MQILKCNRKYLYKKISKDKTGIDYNLKYNFRPAHVGKSLIEVLAKAKSGSVWVVENSQAPKEHH